MIRKIWPGEVVKTARRQAAKGLYLSDRVRALQAKGPGFIFLVSLAIRSRFVGDAKESLPVSVNSVGEMDHCGLTQHKAASFIDRLRYLYTTF